MSLSYSKTLFCKQQTSQDLLLISPIVPCVYLLLQLLSSSFSSPPLWGLKHLKDSTPPVGEGGLCNTDTDSSDPGRSSGGFLQASIWMVTSSLCSSWNWNIWCTCSFGWCWRLRLVKCCTNLTGVSGPFVALAVESVGWALVDQCCTQVYVVKLLHYHPVLFTI